MKVEDFRLGCYYLWMTDRNVRELWIMRITSLDNSNFTISIGANWKNLWNGIEYVAQSDQWDRDNESLTRDWNIHEINPSQFSALWNSI